jgi:glutamine amidotransferase
MENQQRFCYNYAHISCPIRQINKFLSGEDFMIGVIDYKAGNSPSVLNALNKIGCPAMLVKTEEEIASCGGIILPGVGSADATMQSLKEMGCIEVLNDMVMVRKLPFLGICVGLQVLFEYSEEGSTKCLGWLPGKVIRFDDSAVRVPQMGWNKVEFKRDSALLNGMKEGYFYFVNSFHAVPADPGIILGHTYYGRDFCSVVESGNIYASQCHLEKSGLTGLKVLENFAEIAGGDRNKNTAEVSKNADKQTDCLF